MTAGLVGLLNRKVLLLSGEHAGALLQGVISNDIRHLEVKNSLAAFVLNIKGRIEHDIIVHKREDSFVVECSNSHDLKTILERYKIRRRVQIDELDEMVCWSPSDGIPDPRGDLGFRVYSSSPPSTTDDSLWRVHRMEKGVAEGDELRGRLPFLANADYLHQVSIDKGCYIGQELTSRTATQGVLRRRILPFRSERYLEGSISNEEGVKVGDVIGAHSHGGIAILALSALKASLSVGGDWIKPVIPLWMTGNPSRIHLREQ